jgi:hypothetical protein
MPCVLGGDAQRDLLRHRAARHEHRGILPQQCGNPGLERADQRAVPVAIGVPAMLATPFADLRQLLARGALAMTADDDPAAPAQRVLLVLA